MSSFADLAKVVGMQASDVTPRTPLTGTLRRCAERRAAEATRKQANAAKLARLEQAKRRALIELKTDIAIMKALRRREEALLRDTLCSPTAGCAAVACANSFPWRWPWTEADEAEGRVFARQLRVPGTLCSRGWFVHAQWTDAVGRLVCQVDFETPKHFLDKCLDWRNKLSSAARMGAAAAPAQADTTHQTVASHSPQSSYPPRGPAGRPCAHGPRSACA